MNCTICPLKWCMIRTNRREDGQMSEWSCESDFIWLAVKHKKKPPRRAVDFLSKRSEPLKAWKILFRITIDRSDQEQLLP